MDINSLNDIWQAISEMLLQKMNQISYNVWFKDLHLIEIREGQMVFSIYSGYKKNIIESNYMPVFKPIIREIMGIDMDIVIVVEDENGHVLQNEVASPDSTYEDSLTFDNYIVGTCNRFAHAAAMAVADNRNIIYNPLVIYGDTGVGKTHLMLAIRNQIKKKYPEKRIEYVRCETFLNDFISAVHNGIVDKFRETYRNVDVLLIDDIQFIAGKKETQEEFFNTFNSLYQSNKQIVLTMDRTPKEIKTLDDRIRSRLEMGLICDITPPEYETRVGIIRKKAESLNITIDESIVHYVAEHIKVNTRQLEGVVKKIQALLQMNVVPTLSTVQGIVKEVVTDLSPEPIKIDKIISEVARMYEVSENEILSRHKTADVAKARQVAMYIARETTELSYKAIGESFGRDHTTALFSVNKIEELMKNSPYDKGLIEDMIKNLKNEN